MLLAPTEQMIPQRTSCAHVASHQTCSLLIILSERLEVELKHETFSQKLQFLCVKKKIRICSLSNLDLLRNLEDILFHQ